MKKKQIIILCVVLTCSLLGLMATQAGFFRTAFKLKKAQFDFTVNTALSEAVQSIEEKAVVNKDYQGGNVHSLKNMNILSTEENDSLGLNNISAGGLYLDDSDVDADNVKQMFGRNSGLQQSIQRSRIWIKNQLGSDYDIIIKRFDENGEASLEDKISGIEIGLILNECLVRNGVDAAFEYAIKDKDTFIKQSANFFNRSSYYTYKRRIFIENPNLNASIYVIFPNHSYGTMNSVALLLPSFIITVLLILCFLFCIFTILRQKKISTIKNDFINNMTHEFKTPIATISLAGQMLKDGSVDNSADTVKHIAGIITDESKRLTFQVEKVLQTALFTETRMKFKLKNIHLNPIIENFADKFRLRVEDKSGILLTHLDAVEDEIYADEVHIGNVISNLLDNAIKYCDKAPEITVYTRNKDKNLIVSVVDNGIGIARKDQSMIFERFYRVSTGNLHDVKGFGLGLSYVKKIVDAHSGKVRVESEEGKGSRFDVILPLVSCKTRSRKLFK